MKSWGMVSPMRMMVIISSREVRLLKIQPVALQAFNPMAGALHFKGKGKRSFAAFRGLCFCRSTFRRFH
jgi:hypothetical protein